MAHGKISRKKNREQRKLEKMGRRAAKKEAYAAMAARGNNSKKGETASERRLAKDFKRVNLAAVLARPNYGKVPGWVNRKAEQLKAA